MVNKRLLLATLCILAVAFAAVSLWVAEINAAALTDWKTKSEALKNVVEAFAVLAASGTIVAWRFQRHDRSVDTLLKLEELFNRNDVVQARNALDHALSTGQPPLTEAQCDDFAPLLRFYVVLRAVQRAEQIEDRSLSSCYRYWLGYAEPKNTQRYSPVLRTHIDKYWRTLDAWLLEESAKGDRGFFARV
jgi:hypothetical protein